MYVGWAGVLNRGRVTLCCDLSGSRVCMDYLWGFEDNEDVPHVHACEDWLVVLGVRLFEA